MAPRSFKEAQQAFKKESYVNEQEGMAASLDSERGFVDNLLYHAAADADPGRYLRDYDRLAVWVDNCLDMYKVGGGVHGGWCYCW